MQRTAMAILGHEADARDAVADALAAIWRELPRLRDPLAFEAWSTRILVHACRRRLRGRGRARVREVAIESVDASGTGTGGGRSFAGAGAGGAGRRGPPRAVGCLPGPPPPVPP